MGSEQSSLPPKKQAQRAPPVRRGHTIAVPNVSDPSRSVDLPPSGNNSPGTSMCSDSELPYISYTVDRPIGDSPKASAKSQRGPDKKSLLQRRQLSLQPRKSKRTRDIVVVKQPTDEMLDEDIQKLQEISTFLPIMRGTLGLPGARDPEVLEGLDSRPWVRVTSRLQAHLAACAHPLADIQVGLAVKIKEAEGEVSRLCASMSEAQRRNARHAERLARARDVSHHLTRACSLLQQAEGEVSRLCASMSEAQRRNARHAERLARARDVSHHLTRACSLLQQAEGEVSRLCASMSEAQRRNARHAERLARARDVSHHLTRACSLLQQTLLDIEELNALLPEDKRLEPFVWSA